MNDKLTGKDYLLLKWGTVKGWNFDDPDSQAFLLLKRYMDGQSYGCATHDRTEDKKALLCEIIDAVDGEIQNDWTGEIMTKESAKEYVMDCGE